MIKFLDLTKQYKSIKKEVDNAIKKVLNSGVFIGGEELEKLEKEIAEFCKTKYAIGVNSGTDALFLSLKSLEIGPEDEVIVPAFTFISTAEVIVSLGAKPVFVDIDYQSFNIDVEKIEARITKKTKAIIVVHLFGKMAEMDKIMKIARKHKLFIIEDAAQSIGAEHQKTKAGSIGDLGCFSFFPSKNLGAYGDAGMIITNSKKLADKVKLLRTHGSLSKKKYNSLIIGINSRLDSIQAAILRIKLKYLKKWNKERLEIAKYYNQKLKSVGEIIITIVENNESNGINQYTIRTKKRKQLKKYLESKGIETKIYYPLSLHLQPAFKYLNLKKSYFPESEKASKEVLSLPIYPELVKENQDYIIKQIKNFYYESK